MRLTCRSVAATVAATTSEIRGCASAARTSDPSRSSPIAVRRVTSTPSAASVSALPADVPPSPSWWPLAKSVCERGSGSDGSRTRVFQDAGPLTRTRGTVHTLGR